MNTFGKTPTKLIPPYYSGPFLSDHPEVFKWNHHRIHEQLWKMRNPRNKICWLNWDKLAHLTKIKRDHLYEIVQDLIDLEILRLGPTSRWIKLQRIEFSIAVCSKAEWERIKSEISPEKLLLKKKSRKETKLLNKIEKREKKVSELLQLRKSK